MTKTKQPPVFASSTKFLPPQKLPYFAGQNNIEIAKILPHRYPFLLVDKVIHLEKMKRAVGIKRPGWVSRGGVKTTELGDIHRFSRWPIVNHDHI